MLGNQGFISVFSLILMSIILIFSLFLVNLSKLEYLIANANKDNVQAYYSAESKIHLILKEEKYYKELLLEIERYLKYGNVPKFRIIIDDEDLIPDDFKKNVEGIFLKEDKKLLLELRASSSCNKTDCHLVSEINIINGFYSLGFPILSEASIPHDKLDEYIKYIEEIEKEIKISNIDNIIGIDGSGYENINIIFKENNEVTFEFFRNSLENPIKTEVICHENIFFIVKNTGLNPTNISMFLESDLNEIILNGLFYIEGDLKIHNDLEFQGTLIINNGSIEVDSSAELTIEGIVLTKDCKGEEIGDQNNIIVNYNEEIINNYGIYIPGFINPKIQLIKINTDKGKVNL